MSRILPSVFRTDFLPLAILLADSSSEPFQLSSLELFTTAKLPSSFQTTRRGLFSGKLRAAAKFRKTVLSSYHASPGFEFLLTHTGRCCPCAAAYSFRLRIHAVFLFQYQIFCQYPKLLKVFNLIRLPFDHVQYQSCKLKFLIDGRNLLGSA